MTYWKMNFHLAGRMKKKEKNASWMFQRLNNGYKLFYICFKYICQVGGYWWIENPSNAVTVGGESVTTDTVNALRNFVHMLQMWLIVNDYVGIVRYCYPKLISQCFLISDAFWHRPTCSRKPCHPCSFQIYTVGTEVSGECYSNRSK